MRRLITAVTDSTTDPRNFEATRCLLIASMLALSACAHVSQSAKQALRTDGGAISAQNVSTASPPENVVNGTEVAKISNEVPERDALMQPAPNAAWNEVIVSGSNVFKIAPDLYVFRYRYTQSIFMVTDDGVIVTDPISPASAIVFRDAIRAITDQPVKYVIYSHDHWDHVPGGQIFEDEGATFISHEKCVSSWAKISNPDIVAPDVTISGNHRVELGGQSLELLYFGSNHGDCTLVMRPNGGEYLFVVDLVTPGNMPNVWMPDYDLVEWIRSLREIEALEGWTTVIPAHGPIIAHSSAITERREYLELLVERAWQSYSLGGSLNQMVERIEMSEFSHLRGYETNLRGNAERAISIPYMGW